MRALVLALAIGLGLSVCPVESVRADGGSSVPEDIRFRVTRDGTDFGTHSITFRQDGDRLMADVSIDLQVTVAGFTAYRYTHRNTETWVDGRLVALATETDQDGTRFRVSGQAVGQAFITLDGLGNQTRFDADALPTSYWRPGLLQAEALINTQTGARVVPDFERLAEETVTVAGEDRPGIRYRDRGDLNFEIVYDAETHDWIGLGFQRQGYRIVYHRESPVQP